MKKFLLGLALVAGFALAPRPAFADVAAYVTTSTNTPQPFVLGGVNSTPATYTAGTVLGKGVVMTKLFLSMASGTTSTVRVYDSPDGTTWAARCFLKLALNINVSSSTTDGVVKVDLTTAKSQRTDMDGLEFSGFPLILTTAGAPVIATCMARKGLTNTITPY